MTNTPKAKTKRTKLTVGCDLQFTFKYVNINFKVDESYSVEECEKIKTILNTMSETIVIDKSYVEFKENKHNDTFMIEKGWNELCALVISTNFGKNATPPQAEALLQSYCMMLLCYAYQILQKFDYDVSTIYLYMPKDGKFMVEFEEDKIKEWKTYPGKWQTWGNVE